MGQFLTNLEQGIIQVPHSSPMGANSENALTNFKQRFRKNQMVNFNHTWQKALLCE